MKVNNILVLTLLITILQATLLTYIVEKQIDQADTFVQLTAKIQVDGPSLDSSIQTSQNLIKSITKIATEQCKRTAKKGKSKKCEEIVENSKFQVQSKYHLVRKVPTFTRKSIFYLVFILTQQLTIRINDLPSLGKLVDRIVQEGGDLITLQQLVWKTQDEVDPQVTTLKDGLAEGKVLCKKIGKVLQQVVSVEQLQAPEEDQAEESEKDPDLTEPQVEKVIFKFKVQCQDKVKKNKSK